MKGPNSTRRRRTDGNRAALPGPITEREIDWLRDREWARNADDVLWRRSKLGLHTTKPQQEALRTYMASANAVQHLKRVGG